MRDILFKPEYYFIQHSLEGVEKGKRVWNLAIVALVTIKECGQRYEVRHLEHIAIK